MSRIIVVHVSDLHIGSGLIGTRTSHNGLDGHEFLYCELLQSALRNVRVRDFALQSGEQLHFIVSGDFTRIGSENDFYLCNEYLHEYWTRLDRISRRTTGLAIPRGDLYAVPGNHDHWDGYMGGLRPPAYNPKVFPRYFEATPWRVTIPAPGGELALELFGVDSNEGLNGHKANLRAKGVLSAKELRKLNNLLTQSQLDQQCQKMPRIRAIICHHAFAKGKQKSAFFYARPLSRKSRNDLLKTAHPYEVAAVLTGHTHDFEAKDYVDPATGNVLWELRSASTTQMGKQPEPQGFWVHEIELKSERPQWKAWKYQLGPQRASFDRDPNFITVR